MLGDINDVTSDRVLLWAQRLEAQRVQKEVLDSIKEGKVFESIRCITQRQDNENHKKQ